MIFPRPGFGLSLPARVAVTSGLGIAVPAEVLPPPRKIPLITDELDCFAPYHPDAVPVGELEILQEPALTKAPKSVPLTPGVLPFLTRRGGHLIDKKSTWYPGAMP